MNWMEKFKELLFDIITDKEAMKDIMNENEKIERQQAPAQQEPAPAQATDVEPVDELADEVREMMIAAGLDPEDKAAQKAFIAGMAAGKAADEGDVDGQASDEEGKAADGEGEGACTDGEEEKAADECGKANDAAIVHDKAFYAGLYKAAEDVAPFVGKISNPFAFDSAADIYKKALDKAGVVTDGIDPSAFGAMVSMLHKPAAIPQGAVEEDPLNKRLMGIKSN
jgi:DNA-binding protein H-NS